ncbi:histone deacetylase [Gemmatimonadota bacterium]
MGRLQAVWSPSYEVDIGPHVFPTAKYRMVRDRLLAEQVLAEEDFLQPEAATWEEVGRVHSPEYLEKIRTDSLSPLERLTLEVPFSPELREASLLCCGGTALTGRLALQDGVGVHLGGGFHHACSGHGEGFCLLNDVAVALVTLLAEEEIQRAAVVDCDVHQGNGTADILRSETRVFTFSIHQERNYPHPKPPSDLDVGLADGIGDEEYLEALEDSLDRVLGESSPDLVIYLAGADPYEEDQLGGLRLTIPGLRKRDDMVIGECRRAGACVAVVLAGGYARWEEHTVRIHCESVKAALEVLEEG